jgi:hypothetical protein
MTVSPFFCERLSMHAPSLFNPLLSHTIGWQVPCLWDHGHQSKSPDSNKPEACCQDRVRFQGLWTEGGCFAGERHTVVMIHTVCIYRTLHLRVKSSMPKFLLLCQAYLAPFAPLYPPEQLYSWSPRSMFYFPTWPFLLQIIFSASVYPVLNDLEISTFLITVLSSFPFLGSPHLPVHHFHSYFANRYQSLDFVL